MKTGKQYSDSS